MTDQINDIKIQEDESEYDAVVVDGIFKGLVGTGDTKDGAMRSLIDQIEARLVVDSQLETRGQDDY